MFNNLLEAIGNTPLVKLSFQNCPSMYAKLEYLNPSGSVKDRTALFVINHAEQTGALKKGGTIIESSSGNQGISLAMIGAIKGYPVIISTSEKFSKEKLDTIRAYGAKIVISPATKFIDDPQSYHSVAKKMASEIPGAFMPNQYFNPLNAHAFYCDLGPEIWRQTNGKITHFFAAAGTGGTISGTGKFLKEQNPKIKVIGIDSDKSFRSTKGSPQPYKLEGVGIDFDSPVMNYSVIDDIIPVSDENALNMIKSLPTHHGIMVGPSSAAVAYAAEQYMRDEPKDSLAVIILGDSGRAYLSKGFF